MVVFVLKFSQKVDCAQRILMYYLKNSKNYRLVESIPGSWNVYKYVLYTENKFRKMIV